MNGARLTEERPAASERGAAAKAARVSSTRLEQSHARLTKMRRAFSSARSLAARLELCRT